MNVVESSGNVFLNLSDTPLSADYPLPPAGFTILQGQEARDYWAGRPSINLTLDVGKSEVELNEIRGRIAAQSTGALPVIRWDLAVLGTPAIDVSQVKSTSFVHLYFAAHTASFRYVGFERLTHSANDCFRSKADVIARHLGRGS